MGVLWFVGRRSQAMNLVSKAEENEAAHRVVALVEPLEGRVLLSATTVTPKLTPAATEAPAIVPFVASSVTANTFNPAGNLDTPGQNTKTFDVDYYSPDGIDNTTIGTDNLTVSGPNGSVTGALNVVAWTIVSTTSTDTVVQYTFQKSDDSDFTPADDGTYSVSLTATVKDLNTPADTEPARPDADYFIVDIPDVTPPVATKFTASDNDGSFSTGNTAVIQLAGGEQEEFTLTYADNVALDVSTVNTNNVTVTGPNGQDLPVISAVITPPDQNGTPITVTYTCQNPSGLWNASDNGTYYVSINNTLTDTSGNAIVPVVGVGTFTVDLPNVVPPTTVTFTPPSVGNGDTEDTFTVTYTDQVAVNVSSLNSSNVVIIGPHDQAQYGTFVSASPTTNATEVTATYEFTAPDTNTFTAADNGVYTFDLLSTVSDTSGNQISAQPLGTYTLALNPADIARSLVGQFGVINGKNVPLKFRDIPNGGVGTFRLTGGVGDVYLETANSNIDIYVADSGGGVKLTINSSAAHPLQIGNVLIDGTLLKGVANTSELRGTFFATGSIQQLTLGNIFGSVVAAGPIGTVDVVHGISGGEILSGVNLGSDGQFGGTGTAADSYGAGSIGTVKATSIASAFIGAGVNPGADGQFGTSDDTLVGGSSSMISYLQAKIIDTTTKFEAGSFGSAKLENKFVNVSTDTQFIVPTAST